MSLPSNQSLRAYLALPAVFAAALAIVSVSGCGGDDSPAQPTGTPDATIRIVVNASGQGLMAFSPNTTTVQINQVVRMTNGDGVTHTIQTVTSGGPSWGTLSAGASADRQVTLAGTFNFRCTIGGHVMNGTVIVTP